jgi:hypothetical protein
MYSQFCVFCHVFPKMPFDYSIHFVISL